MGHKFSFLCFFPSAIMNFSPQGLIYFTVPFVNTDANCGVLETSCKMGVPLPSIMLHTCQETSAMFQRV